MSIWDDIGDAVEAVGEGAVDLAKAAAKLAEDAARAAAEAAEDAARAAAQAAEDAAKAAAQAAEDAAKAAAKAAEDAARALENAVNDTYEWGSGAADTLGKGVADAADWGVGAFETVGKAFVDDVDWEELGAEFASGAIDLANRFFGGEDTEKFEDKSFAYDGTGPYFGEDAGSQFANGGGEDEPIGRVGQALGSMNPGPDLSNIVSTLDEARAHTGFGGVPLDSGIFPDKGIFDAIRVALEQPLTREPDLSDATPTVDEALVATSVSSVALANADGADQSSAVGALLKPDLDKGSSLLDGLTLLFDALGDASDAGIIVVGGHEGPAAAFTEASTNAAAESVVGGIAQEHRELARETLEGVELPTSIPELVNQEPFNERPFELPGLDGPFGGRDLFGWLEGKGGYGGPNGPGGIPGGLGGPGGFEGLPGWLVGDGGPGDFGGFPGGFGGPSGDGAPIGDGGFGGEFGGFGGLPGWLTGNGKGGLDGLFGDGPGDWGPASGFGGIDTGGSGGLDGLGIGLPPDLGGSRMPDIKLKGEDAMWHEEGNKVVADKGETLQVERGNKSFTVNEGKSFEKQEGDQFVSNKEPNTYYHVSDGKVEKVGGSNSGGTADSKPHPGDPKGMPADGEGGGGPNWSYAMPADNSVGGGGPSWSLHDTSAIAALADTQPTTGDHQFASAFSAIDSQFSLDGMATIGSHLWF